MGIQINGNNDIISALDGSWTAEGASINTSGILTATTFKGNIVGTAATFTGPVTIGGTLTYEDVTNIDAVGLITARNGIIVTAGVSTFAAAIDANGGANIAGGLVVNSAKISDLTDNRIVIAGTSGELEDSANLTYNGSTVAIHQGSPNSHFKLDIGGHANVGGDVALPTTNRIYWGNSDTAFIKGEHGGSAYLSFGANNEKMRLTRTGRLGIGTDNPTYNLHVDSADAAIGLWKSRRSSGSYIEYAVGANGAALGYIGAGGQILTGGADSGDFAIRSQGDLCFASGGAAEKVRITSGGDLCIGRTSTISNAKLAIHCDATEPAIAIQCNHTNTDTDLITAFNSGGKNIVNITAETDNSPYLKFEILSGSTAIERFRVNHLGNVAIGGGIAPNRLEIIQDPLGFPSDSAQPNATLLIKHGTSGTNRRWVGIGASLTGAWIQSSSPGGTGLAAPLWINKGGGDVTLGNDKFVVKSSGDVGIGIVSPGVALDVSGAVQATGGFKTAGHPVVTYASFTDISGGSYATRLGSTGTSTLKSTQIYGGGSHIATFDGVNNRLGINVTDPDNRIEIRTTAHGQGLTIKSTGSTSNTIYLDANRSGANNGIGQIAGRWNGTTVAQMSFNTGDDTTDKNDGYIWFGTETAASNGNVNATERLRITSDGHIDQNLTTASGTSPFQDTNWYDRDGGKFTLTYSDFNEIKILKLENANDYNRICYRRERMSHNCDIEFDLEGNAPSGTYRHVGFVLNGDGTSTASNFDRLVFRTRPSNTNNNQIRLDKGGGGSGFNIQNSNVPAWFDGTSRHIKIQIRRRIFNVFVDGEIKYSETTDADLVRTHGWFGVIIYEAGTTSPWVKLRNFRIRNRFTKPQWLVRASGVNVDVASGDPFPFNQSLVVSADMSGSSYYNTSTYKYTIPITGTYYVFHRVYRNSSTSAEVAYYVNNNVRVRFRPLPQGGDYIFSGSAMLSLDKDDTISVNSYNGQLDNFYGNSSEAFSSWGGHLIE